MLYNDTFKKCIFSTIFLDYIEGYLKCRKNGIEQENSSKSGSDSDSRFRTHRNEKKGIEKKTHVTFSEDQILYIFTYTFIIHIYSTFE